MLQQKERIKPCRINAHTLCNINKNFKENNTYGVIVGVISTYSIVECRSTKLRISWNICMQRKIRIHSFLKSLILECSYFSSITFTKQL